MNRRTVSVAATALAVAALLAACAPSPNGSETGTKAEGCTNTITKTDAPGVYCNSFMTIARLKTTLYVQASNSASQ